MDDLGKSIPFDEFYKRMEQGEDTKRHLRSMQKNLSSILNLFCRKAKIFYMSASLPAFQAS